MSDLFLKKFLKFLALILIGAGLGTYIAQWNELTADKLGWLLFAVGCMLVAVVAFVERESPSPKRFFSGRILRALGAIVIGIGGGYAFGTSIEYAFGEGSQVNLLTYYILVGICVGAGFTLWVISIALTPVTESKMGKTKRPRKRPS